MEERAQQQCDDQDQPTNAIGTQAGSIGTQAGSIGTQAGSVRPASMASENNQTPNNPDTPIEVEIVEIAEASKGKLKSAVWRHFSRELKDGVVLAKCPDCKKELQGGSSYGTTHLRNHMKSCLYRKQKKIGQCTLNGVKSGDGSMILGTYQFDQNRSRKELAKMIIMHEYPLAMVDHRGFRSFMFSVNPSFMVVTRNTIKNDILKMFEYEKEKCMKLLDANKSRIALTTDMWTSSNKKRGFMAITSHFIDDSWKLQSRLIRFIYVPCPHTAEILERELMECLYDWNLDRKLSTLTVDNCTTNDAIVDLVLQQISPSLMMLSGKFFHMRCSAHILNLIVRDGLEVIKSSVEKIRYSVQFWTASAKREEKFEEAAKQLRVAETKKLELDCLTRWNSTYNMLKTAMGYKDVFPRLKQREPLYKNVPSEDDWAKTKQIAEKLALFYNVTVLFSGTKYPTANLFFKNICLIRLALEEWILSEQRDVAAMALKMIAKFEKYWDTMHGLLSIASILDPRYKMKMIQFFFPKIYPVDPVSEMERVKQLFYDLVEEYQIRSKQSQELAQASGHSSSSRTTKKARIEDEFDSFMENSVPTQAARSELDYYLEETLLPRTDGFDILTWWKSNGVKYPTLHDIARDVLAIPISTVASESSFSTSGRIISPHRSRLHSKTVEALMCARDWIWREIEDCDDFENFEDYDVFVNDGSAPPEESDISSGTSEANIFVPENISLYE